MAHRALALPEPAAATFGRMEFMRNPGPIRIYPASWRSVGTGMNAARALLALGRPWAAVSAQPADVTPCRERSEIHEQVGHA